VKLTWQEARPLPVATRAQLALGLKAPVPEELKLTVPVGPIGARAEASPIVAVQLAAADGLSTAGAQASVVVVARAGRASTARPVGLPGSPTKVCSTPLPSRLARPMLPVDPWLVQ
jgi:hypothetical protein